MIIVTMTSWSKRIGVVSRVIDSILNSTLIPNKIYLSLSLEEFPRKEFDIPVGLNVLMKRNPSIVLNWVEGENTKTWKKIFPLIDTFDDNDIIITTDDDIILPPDLLQTRVSDFFEYGCKYAISGRDIKSFTFSDLNILGATSVYTKKMLKNWEKLMDDDLLKTYHDERFCGYLLWLNGYKTKPCSKHDLMKSGLLKTNFDKIFPLHKTLGYPSNKDFDNLILPKIEHLTGNDIHNSFGYFINGSGNNDLLVKKNQ